MKKRIVLFGLVLALCACSSEPTPPLTVNRPVLPKIGMDVQRITLADRSGIQAANSPYNTNHFSPTISEAIKQWAVDRLQANGQSGQAIVLIKKASLTAQPLPMESGIDSWFKRQQGVKYVARAEVSIEANGKGGFAVADASASRAVTLPEDPTPIEKQNAYYEMLNDLMKDLGENLESSIHGHMANFVTTAPVFGATAVPLSDVAPKSGGVQPKVDQAPISQDDEDDSLLDLFRFDN